MVNPFNHCMYHLLREHSIVSYVWGKICFYTLRLRTNVAEQRKDTQRSKSSVPPAPLSFILVLWVVRLFMLSFSQLATLDFIAYFSRPLGIIVLRARFNNSSSYVPLHLLGEAFDEIDHNNHAIGWSGFFFRFGATTIISGFFA